MYWVLAIATLLGGLAALWFFWDKLWGVDPAQMSNPSTRDLPDFPAATDGERKARLITAWRGQQVTLSQMNTGKAARLLGPVRGRSIVTVLECNDMFVTVRVGDSSRSIPLRRVDLSHDGESNRPELQERQE